ncbi:8127_t:CDS:2 [Gigaspora margarita]|uniref:8127_t:CDS:1 n=1 Tax=Gigaspora margarita TaxID=4874 RepID=A0ABN7V3I8_GIGMA|nr:8127_t:CDS:2 [Gigaspora margarita]
MVTFAILNDLATINQPDKHYMVILFPDIEKYDILQIILNPLQHDLYNLKLNGINDKFRNYWMKFLTICLGFNAANSKYFCPWCTCQKSEIGLINKSWTIKKSIESINQNIKSYLGHNKKPLFNMIKLKNWVPDELHIFLRITDCLWDLAVQEYKNDNRFSQEYQQLICAEMK